MTGASRPLADLAVLVMDIQATGPDPSRNFPMEIAWARMTGAKASGIESSLVQPSPGQVIPRPVEAITGISQEQLAGGRPLAHVWREFAAAEEAVARQNAGAGVPLVVHWYRFEKKYVESYNADLSPDAVIPLAPVCTHDIARRLFPELPRSGLRALAGFLGYSLGAVKRAPEHVAATCFVWAKLVQALAEKAGITTLDQLTTWLAEKPGKVKIKKAYPMDESIWRALPDAPGVYRMFRSNGDILYVGKATSLKQRVRSYFREFTRHVGRTLEMLTQAKDLQVTPTASEVEAALLETDEIKRLAPPYNVALQRAGREIYFVDRYLRLAGMGADTVGPVVAPAAFQALGATRASLRKPPAALSAQAGTLLGMPAAYAPDEEIFLEGFRRFAHAYRSRAARSLSRAWVMKQGAKLWREKLRRLARDGRREILETEEEENEREAPEFAWTPDAVFYALERNIRQAAWALRRAEWLVRLSESSLAWVERDPPRKRTHVLILAGGKISRSELRAGSPELPVPPGHRKPPAQRRRDLDLAAYDRLRILTTELKRLAAEGRLRGIRFGPRSALNPKQFARLAPWI